jgi:Fructose/tagatose bisphosphate aldolase
MIDGSHELFEDNIALTKRVVDVAKPNDIPVEAELGKVGGKEDDLDGGNGGYTDPLEAKEFVERTGISSLAVAIGTAHGVYTGVPKLDIDRLKAIRKVVEIPLVLHGASGLTDESVIECIGHGICKVNFATELRMAYSDGVKKLLAAKPDTYDPKAYGKAGRENVKELVKNRIIITGGAR